MLYGIWLSAPQGMYCIRSVMNTGAMLCCSLKTSLVLGVKAAALLVPGMVTTDVGGINEKSLISCFFEGKDMSDVWVGKRHCFYFLIARILCQIGICVGFILRYWQEIIVRINVSQRLNLAQSF